MPVSAYKIMQCYNPDDHTIWTITTLQTSKVICCSLSSCQIWHTKQQWHHSLSTGKINVETVWQLCYYCFTLMTIILPNIPYISEVNYHTKLQTLLLGGWSIAHILEFPKTVRVVFFRVVVVVVFRGRVSPCTATSMWSIVHPYWISNQPLYPLSTGAMHALLAREQWYPAIVPFYFQGR
jgi:hypothetical protein